MEGLRDMVNRWRTLRMPAVPTFVIDLSLAWLVAIIGLVQIIGEPRQRGPVSILPTILTILCAALLLFRSRFPLATVILCGTVAFAMTAVGLQWFPILPALLVAIYSAVAYSPRPRIVIWSTAGAVLILLVAGLTVGDMGRPGFGPSIPPWTGQLAWVVFPFLFGEAMRNRRDAMTQATLRMQQAEHAREEESLRRVSEERLQIARELHDIVAHNLALINVQAGVAAHVMDSNPEQAREAFINIKQTSHAALQELRSMLKVLRDPDTGAPAMTPTAGLDQLNQLIGSVRDAGVNVNIHVDTNVDNLPATVDVAAYRILQEALTNVVKHATDARVDVSVSRLGDALVVSVMNSASATPDASAKGTGSGLAGMRERVLALGGTLDAGKLPDGGFRVRATLPAAIR